jgi:hypothetical protein
MHAQIPPNPENMALKDSSRVFVERPRAIIIISSSGIGSIGKHLPTTIGISASTKTAHKEQRREEKNRNCTSA